MSETANTASSLKVRQDVHRSLAIIAAVRGEQIGVLVDEILRDWLKDHEHSIEAEMMWADVTKKKRG